MSRTWKDRPAYIQANDPKNQKNALESHYCGARWVILKKKTETVTKTYDWGYGKPEVVEYKRTVVTLWGSEYEPCDLNEDNIREGRYTYVGCHYTPAGRSDWDWSYSKPRKDERKNRESEIRGERRNKTKRLVDEYNSVGYIEEDYYFLDNKQKGWWD